MTDAYEFTQDWFSRSIPIWEQLLASWKPSRAVEIGSFEGRSATYLIDACATDRPVEIWCVDSWAGGVEHHAICWPDVERRFDCNTARAAAHAANPVAVHKRKGASRTELARLLLELGEGTIDFIFIDGSHQAPDVLSDAVLAFPLLRVGGIMVFDDYIWSEGDLTTRDLLQMPKPAIDAFLNLYARKMTLIWGGPVQHIAAEKIAE